MVTEEPNIDIRANKDKNTTHMTEETVQEEAEKDQERMAMEEETGVQTENSTRRRVKLIQR
jgi:hypothetical protein